MLLPFLEMAYTEHMDSNWAYIWIKSINQEIYEKNDYMYSIIHN